MTITIDRQTDVYSRPNARFGGDGTLEIRASAVGNCRRALWLEATGHQVTNPRDDDSLTMLEAGNALRRGTPLDEIIDQIRGISEMQPWPNRMEDGRTVYVRGLGDAIALVLGDYLETQVEAEPAELPIAAD